MTGFTRGSSSRADPEITGACAMRAFRKDAVWIAGASFPRAGEGARLGYAHLGRTWGEAIMNCPHQPHCPPADAPDCEAAHVLVSHPEQGWSLLCNGVVLFEDTGDLLPDGRVITPHRDRLDLELVPCRATDRDLRDSARELADSAASRP